MFRDTNGSSRLISGDCSIRSVKKTLPGGSIFCNFFQKQGGQSILAWRDVKLPGTVISVIWIPFLCHARIAEPGALLLKSFTLLKLIYRMNSFCRDISVPAAWTNTGQDNKNMRSENSDSWTRSHKIMARRNPGIKSPDAFQAPGVKMIKA